MKTDEIIEGLEGIKTHIQSFYSETMLEDSHLLSLAAAIDHLKAMQWVPIADIPDEWKDGRPVDLLTITADLLTGTKRKIFRHVAVRFIDGKWQTGSEMFVSYYDPTHVMLPIAPPALGKQRSKL